MTRAQLSEEIGWTWRVLGHQRGVAHLVPPRILSGSRTVCGLPLHGRVIEEPLVGLFLELRRCARCKA